jgi:hypothetical protein
LGLKYHKLIAANSNSTDRITPLSHTKADDPIMTHHSIVILNILQLDSSYSQFDDSNNQCHHIGY